MVGGVVSAADWMKGISLSILASIIGASSKLAIRKSWLLEASLENEEEVRALSQRSLGTNNTDSSGDSLEEPLLMRLGRQWLGSDDDDDDDDGLSPADVAFFKKMIQRLAFCLRWSGMFGMSVLNPFCCVLAMNYASPSILAPFSGLTLVWVILFSHSLVGERPSRAQQIAAALIVVGEAVVAIFGDHTNDEGVTVSDVRDSYLDSKFLGYFVFLFIYILVVFYWMCYAKSPIVKRYAWGTGGGAITGLQNFLKDALTIYKAPRVDGSLPWFFPLLMLFAAGTAFGGLLLLTSCMKRYDATYSAATFVGSFVVSASIMSAVHYDTFQNLESLTNYLLYPVGLLTLMVGVAILVYERSAVESIQDIITDSDIEQSQHGLDPVRKGSEDSTQNYFAYTQVDGEREGGLVRDGIVGTT